MKVIFSILLFTQMFFVSSQVLEKVKLKMKIPALTEDFVVLYRYQGHEQVFIDSIRFGSNGLAKYTGVKLEKGLYNVMLPNSNTFELVIAEPYIYIETSLVTPDKNMLVKKSTENMLYYGFQQFVSKQRKEILEQYKRFQKGEISQVKFDEVQMTSTNNIRKEKTQIIDSNKGTLVADLLLAGMNPSFDKTQKEPYLKYLEDYLDNIHFENPALLNSPLMYSRVIEFLDQMVAPYPEEKIREIKNILSRCDKSPDTESYLIKTLIKHYEDFTVVGNDEVFVFLVEGYDNLAGFDIQESRRLKSVANVIDNYVRGKKFEPLSLQGKDALNNMQSKYTLIVVYDDDASKRELELIYNFGKSYEAKGIKICAVGLGENAEKLHIGQVNHWVHLKAGLELKNELYMHENVMMILLDTEKKVLARDITLDFLIDTLNVWEK